MLEVYLEGKIPVLWAWHTSSLFIHATNSQVISQALVSATNSVDLAFALHVCVSRSYQSRTQQLTLFLVTACMFPQLLTRI